MRTVGNQVDFGYLSLQNLIAIAYEVKESPAEPKEPADVPGVPVSPPKVSRNPDGRMQYEYERMTMADLAYTLTPMLDLPVVDRTGLTGSYQVALELNTTLPNAPGRGANTAALAPSPLLDPFETVQKLGLRLEKQKAAIDTIVVESADKTPTAN